MHTGTIVMLIFILVVVFGGTFFLVGKTVSNGEKKKNAVGAPDAPENAGNGQ
ncbi:MAG: hypothetical protein PUC44_03270 [Eubacteriales bacterium]|nr:hypothetical protein [Eubacteriales bacterium]